LIPLGVGDYQGPEGVNITAPYFGGVDGVRFLDAKTNGKAVVWDNVITALVDQFNYVVDVDIRAATFDWRQGPDATDKQFPKIVELIEQTYKDADNTKVALTSLSM
jgi:hypothetical protein